LQDLLGERAAAGRFEPLPTDEVKRVAAVLKLTGKQVVLCYECFKLIQVPVGHEEQEKQYRLMVRRRLADNLPDGNFAQSESFASGFCTGEEATV
jgi:hypothetical protein